MEELYELIYIADSLNVASEAYFTYKSTHFYALLKSGYKSHRGWSHSNEILTLTLYTVNKKTGEEVAKIFEAFLPMLLKVDKVIVYVEVKGE